MTSDINPSNRPVGSVVSTDAALRFMQLVARMLLEYSTRAEIINHQIDRLASHFGIKVLTFIAYRDVTICVADGRQFHSQAAEHRLNVAVSVRMMDVVDAVCAGRMQLEEAIRQLEAVEGAPRHYGTILLAVIFGLASSALAWLLRADAAAIAASGVSAGIGLIVRQRLGRLHVVLFTFPFTAGLIGAILGGVVTRLGWTQTPGLCLLVPALMLVPGVHLINSADDMLRNHMQTGVGRLVLAVGILVAAALGVFLGSWLTLGTMTVSMAPSETIHLTLLLDVVLAGVAACGFAAYYNAPWKVLWVSIAGGMVGHGIRYVSMEQGMGQGIATLFACLAIGVIARFAADQWRLPFAAVAFAASVPMMPGVFAYESIAGAAILAPAGMAADPKVAAATLALFFKSVFIVGAMAVGLFAGDRVAGLSRARAPRR